MQQYTEEIKKYIKDNWHASLKKPQGELKCPFIDPAAAYRGQLWDWDSFFCATALIDVYDDITEYIKGCVMNFLGHMREDSSVPYVIDANPVIMEGLPSNNIKSRGASSDINSAKPLLAQMAMLAVNKEGSADSFAPYYKKLKKYISHWEKTQLTASGLFVWRSHRGSGTDNHPAIYGRPLNSSAGTELNSFMYKEYLAFADLAQHFGKDEDAAIYKEKAANLKENINKHMWDDVDGMYYHLDMLSKKPQVAHQEISWDVPLKFKTWTSFMPMWAEIAPEEYAEIMVKKHLMNREEFFSDYGLRSLAKNERMYSTAETSNPSNWQGPIWIVSNFLMYKGLLNYGYKKEAKTVAENLQKTLYEDLKTNGCMHEYYNPETGKSSINAGFMNWNALAGLMETE